MKPILLFDFDGVICDALPNALKLIQKHMAPTFTWQDFSDAFAGNIWESFQSRGVTLKDKAQFSAEKRVIVREDPNNWGPIFPEMKDVTTELAKHYTLYIITSNQEWVVEQVLKHNDMIDLFEDILGRDTLGNKQEKIQNLQQQFQEAMNDTYLVSDSVGDIREAHEAGIQSIGVTWGIHPHDTLKKGSPAHICDTPEDLLEILT